MFLKSSKVIGDTTLDTVTWNHVPMIIDIISFNKLIYTYKIKMFVCLCETLGDIMWKM